MRKKLDEKEIAREIARLMKKSESDDRLIESLHRHIGALEGRDKERVERIKELEEYIANRLVTE